MPIHPDTLLRIKRNDPTLVSLNLSYQKLTVADIQELVAALENDTSLITVDLTGNLIGDEGAILLAKSTSLISLTVAGACIGEKGAIALAQHPVVSQLFKLVVKNLGAFSLDKIMPLMNKIVQIQMHLQH